MKQQCSLAGLIALIALIPNCSELRNKFQLGNAVILSETELFISEYLYLGLVMIFVRVLLLLPAGVLCTSRAVKACHEEV